MKVKTKYFFSVLFYIASFFGVSKLTSGKPENPGDGLAEQLKQISKSKDQAYVEDRGLCD